MAIKMRLGKDGRVKLPAIEPVWRPARGRSDTFIANYADALSERRKTARLARQVEGLTRRTA